MRFDHLIDKKLFSLLVKKNPNLSRKIYKIYIMTFDFLICYSKNDKYLEDSKILLPHHFLAKLGTFFQPYY